MCRRRTAMALLAALTAVVACTDDGSTVPGVDQVSTVAATSAPPSDTGSAAFQTLPPVGEYSYPTGTTDVVVQIAVDDQGLDVPLLTVYGGLTAVASTDDGWRSGTITDFTLQEFLADAASVGLLDGSLSLRGPDPSAAPQIVVRFDVDGTPLIHELDLSAIERPPALRRFLQDATSSNRFDLTDRYDPGTWITCEPTVGPDAPSPFCSVVDEQSTDRDRPILPHESDPTLLLP
jgi:hypothetical protein